MSETSEIIEKIRWIRRLEQLREYCPQADCNDVIETMMKFIDNHEQIIIDHYRELEQQKRDQNDE